MWGIRDELKKINSVSTVIAILVFIFIGNIVITFFYHDSSFSSKKALYDERDMYAETLETYREGIEDEYDMKDICIKKIAIIDYCIENNIPYQQLSVISNLSKNVLLINFIIIFMLLLVYNLISVEYSNGTWKYLIILNKGNYKRIMLKKKLAVYTIILGVTFIFLVSAIIYGSVVYKEWSNVVIDYINGKIIVTTYTSEIINMIIGLLVRGIVYGSLTFLLAVILKEKKIGIIGMVLLVLFENTIYTFLDNFKVSVVLPYRYLYILENVSDYQALIVGKAVIYIIVFLVLLNLLTYWLLKNKWRFFHT